MRPLFERYRPQSLEGVAGQPEAVNAVRAIIASGNGTAGGRAWFISGASGTGKTTLARILAAGVAGWTATEETNGADLTLDDVRRIERDMSCRALPSEPDGPTGRCWIINEAHLIRGLVLSRLLTTIEPDEGLPPYVAIIFTTTAVGQARMFGDHDDASPLVSRCVEIRLDNGPESQRERALAVRSNAIAAGCDGFAPESYVSTMAEVKGNTRMLYQRVEARQLGVSMPVAAPVVKPKKLAPLPDEKGLRALPLAAVRQLCADRGAADGWCKAASHDAAVRWLLKNGGTK